MTKVVYNAGFGGFGLSAKALTRLVELGFDLDDLTDRTRHDPRLVQVVEELGRAAAASWSKLRIHTLQGNRYIIQEYDGSETVVEPEDIEWIEV